MVKTAKSPTPKHPRIGRPSLNDRAMTAAEKQRAYRERRKDAVLLDDVGSLSRVDLISRLSSALKGIEEYTDEDLREGAQYLSEQVIGELCRRFQLKPRKR